jgi:hypothetical protein
MEIDNSNIDNNFNLDILEECIICYNQYNIKDGIIFECNHKMCIKCYQIILNNTSNLTCPICRRSLENKQELELEEQEQPEEHNTQPSFIENITRCITENIIYTTISNYCKCASIITLIFITILLIINIIINIEKKN